MCWNIVYPVILLGKQGVWVACDSAHLITTQKSLLRAGLYNDRLVVDSAGSARHLQEARELAVGLGLLSRWRALWSPSALIRVELVFDSEITSVSVEEFKERLLESFARGPQKLAEWRFMHGSARGKLILPLGPKSQTIEAY